MEMRSAKRDPERKHVLELHAKAACCASSASRDQDTLVPLRTLSPSSHTAFFFVFSSLPKVLLKRCLTRKTKQNNRSGLWTTLVTTFALTSPVTLAATLERVRAPSHSHKQLTKEQGSTPEKTVKGTRTSSKHGVHELQP